MKRKGLTFSVDFEEQDDCTAEFLESAEQKAAEAMKESSSSVLAGHEFQDDKGVKSTSLESRSISIVYENRNYDFDLEVYDYYVLVCCEEGLESLDNVDDFTQGLCRRIKSFGIGFDGVGRNLVCQPSTIFMTIFFKGFACKMSCLQRLKDMVEGVRDLDTSYILPIFFGIEPSQVLEEFQSSFEENEAIEHAIIEAIEHAILEATNMNGWLIPETVRPNEIDSHIKEVCQMVLHIRKLSLLRTGHHLVGMDQDVQGIMNLLNLEINDVRIVAILGEDGSGKTTLARALYDELSSGFDGCSFLADIREIAAHSGDIRYLQAKLASDLLSRECEVLQSVDEGINLIRERFCHMKVLIVLDDIVESCHLEALAGQLNWFGRGSRIIITTEHNGFIPLTHHMYNAQGFANDDNALQIFSRHAFPRGSQYHALRKKILRALPSNGYNTLAIEILGSMLYGKLEAEWESVFLNLTVSLESVSLDIEENSPFSFAQRWIISRSYGSLNEKQKEMFLDMSCFPSGMDRRVALLLWYDSLRSSSFHDFEVLLRLCLVKVDANNGIWMHRLVRSFGRDVIRGQLYSSTNREGDIFFSGGSEALCPPSVGLGHMDNVRFFKLEHEKICRTTDRDCMQQRNLIWQGRFPPFLNAEHHAELLKVLDLSWSKITEDWEFWDQIRAPRLRVLNLTGCADLMITPNFSFCPDLEMLTLEHCSRLVKIHPSICMLQRLVIFNLRYCTELSMLPKEVGCLKALELFLIDGTSIQEIPVSISHLKKLRVFTAMNCSSLTRLPSSTCHLSYLKTLKLNCVDITELPCSIFERVKLQYLSLRDCHSLTSLGPFVGEVERSLVKLDVSGTSISELPESIANLQNLRVLKMEFCFIREFPPRFQELKKLEEIYASWCRRLRNLPHYIEELLSLRILKLGHSSISSVPKSIWELENLETLDLTSCNKLQSLPVLPSSLTSLHVQSKELKKLPDLYSMHRRLKECTLACDASVEEVSGGLKFDPLYWLPQSSLRTLGLCFPRIRSLPCFPGSLRKLTIQCQNLEHISQFPSTLVVISILDLRTLKYLPNVENLQKSCGDGNHTLSRD